MGSATAKAANQPDKVGDVLGAILNELAEAIEDGTLPASDLYFEGGILVGTNQVVITMAGPTLAPRRIHVDFERPARDRT